MSSLPSTTPATSGLAHVRSQQRNHSGALPFIAGNMLLGTVGIFVHAAGAAPLTAVWFRCAFGLLGLTGWLAWRGLLPQLRLGRPTAPWVLASAVLMVAGWAIFFQAMAYIPAGIAIVLFHVQPLWLLLFGALWLGEPIGRQRLLAVLAALLGLALATGVAQHLPLFDNTSVAESADGYWLGVALCMLGAVVMALLTLCVKKVPQVHASALTWWHCLLGTAVLWLGPAHSGWPAVGSTWLWLAGVGLVHTALAYTLIYAGTARLPMARLAVLQYMYPAVAILIDWAYFGQYLSGLQLLGIALMSAAIGYAERPQRSLQPAQPTRTGAH